MGRVIDGFIFGKGKVRTNKRYRWFIPKALDDKVSKGDIVLARVKAKDKNILVPVLVVDILEHDNIKHKPVVDIIKRYNNNNEKDTKVKKKSKLSDSEKLEIRVKRAEGKKLKELAEMYSCSISLIHKIINESEKAL